jgi:hypothetical protein
MLIPVNSTAMEKPTKPSIAVLRRRVDSIFDLLAEAYPEEVDDLRSLLELIRRREASTGKDFEGVRSPREVITLCLTERNSWMTKQEIFDRLVEGGFLSGDSPEKWLMNDNIRNGLTAGRFVQKGETKGWDTLIGLPQFQSRKS